MKTLKALFAIILIVLIAIISYYIGYNNSNKQHSKDYQAACILATCCNNMIDNIGFEAEEIYYEYIDNLDCYSNITLTKTDIDNYNSWQYNNY